MARPTSFKPEYVEQVYKLCLLGATDKDLANFFGVSEQTINSWKEKQPEFLESLKEGKEKADTEVASKLFHRAIGYEHEEMITASYQGKITDTMVVKKHYPPDTTAAIFWLKNRKPEEWRDKQVTELTGKDGGAIEIDSPREEIERRIIGIASRLREKEDTEGSDGSADKGTTE